jgi:hypothetical protein
MIEMPRKMRLIRSSRILGESACINKSALNIDQADKGSGGRGR